jgi:formylglycine-generating enzyme required for sulfatase activity
MFGGVYSIGAVAREVRQIRIKLYPRGELPSGMVYVPGGSYQLNISRLEHVLPLELHDYLIDRYEVTNRQYKEFVTAGGYRDRTYWREPLVSDGHAVPWHEAVARFVDRTGRPGPATWEAGDYLEGQDEYPVGGLSWYEAAAYARFAGKSLPSVYHWGRAAGSAAASWIVPRSNFAGQGPARIGTHTGMSQFGAYDMAGNVREWCLNRSEDQRYILGGSWNDATYLFGILPSPNRRGTVPDQWSPAGHTI